MEDGVFPADAEYAEELQFQETLMASIIISQMKRNDPLPTLSKEAMEVPGFEDHMQEAGGDCAGQSSMSFCEICVERKENDQMFTSSSYIHSICVECVTKHVSAKIDSCVSTITRPGLDCKAVLEVETCRPMLPKGVIDLWEETSEDLIDASQRFYCQYKDCSHLMINESSGEEKGEVIREAECPFCYRLFCALCCVPWHAGVECEEYQMLNEDEKRRISWLCNLLATKNRVGARGAGTMLKGLKAVLI